MNKDLKVWYDNFYLLSHFDTHSVLLHLHHGSQVTKLKRFMLARHLFLIVFKICSFQAISFQIHEFWVIILGPASPQWLRISLFCQLRGYCCESLSKPQNIRPKASNRHGKKSPQFTKSGGIDANLFTILCKVCFATNTQASRCSAVERQYTLKAVENLTFKCSHYNVVEMWRMCNIVF